MRYETGGIRPREQGYTLVEILVALAIASIVISGAYRSLSRITSSTNTEQLVLDMQMNARNVSLRLSRDIRNAGYWGCVGGAAKLAANTLNSATIDYSADPVSWVNNDADGANSYKNETDVISLGYSDPDAGGVAISKMNNNSADIQLVSAGPFEDDDIAVISDCIRYSIFQITQINTPGPGMNLVHNTGAGSPGNSTKNLGYVYNETAKVYHLTKKTYYLDANNGTMRLVARSGNNIVPIADYIEDLQFQYGWDQNQDGTLDNTEFADNPAATNAKDIQAVRLFILARTAMPADGYTDRNYYEYPNSPYYNPAVNTYGSTNGPGGQPGDGYRRYLVATLVTLRNKSM